MSETKNISLKEFIKLLKPKKIIEVELIGGKYETKNTSKITETELTEIASQVIEFEIETLIFIPNKDNPEAVYIRPAKPIESSPTEIPSESNLYYRVLIEYKNDINCCIDLITKFDIGIVNTKFITTIKVASLKIDDFYLVF